MIIVGTWKYIFTHTGHPDPGWPGEGSFFHNLSRFFAKAQNDNTLGSMIQYQFILINTAGED